MNTAAARSGEEEAPCYPPAASPGGPRFAEERLARAVEDLRERYGPSEAAAIVEAATRLADQIDRTRSRRRA